MISRVAKARPRQVHADMVEHAVFDLVPLARSRRVVANLDFKSAFLREALQRKFPEADPAAVAATPIRRDQQLVRLRVEGGLCGPLVSINARNPGLRVVRTVLCAVFFAVARAPEDRTGDCADYLSPSMREAPVCAIEVGTGLSPRSPLRTGRADLPHPALQSVVYSVTEARDFSFSGV